MMTSSTAYEQMLKDLLDSQIPQIIEERQRQVISSLNYRQITPPNDLGRDLVLEVVPVRVYQPPPDTALAEDPRLLFRDTTAISVEKSFGFSFQGIYDIEGLTLSSELSAVPLETYFPPHAVWRYDEAGEPVEPRALHPTLNPFGYVQTPPLILTTLKAARVLAGEDAISAVRVRVSGIDRFSSEAQVRIEAVASEIVRRTGLEVDVVVGSSPRPVLVHIPGAEVPGENTEDIPPLGYVEEYWIQKGVSLTTHEKVQWANVLLFGAMLVVCTVFILNATTTTVLGRVHEFGLLKALGWRTTSLARLVLGEGLLVGFVAGGVGVALAAGLAAGLGLALPLERAVLVWPLGLLLCLVGYLFPALWAGRVAPAAAVKQGEITQGGGRAPRWLGYAGRALWRRRARALLSGAVVAAGAGMLTFLLGLLWGLRGYLTLTLLGQYVLMHVEGYHWAMVGLILGVGALAVVDTLLVGVAERRREIGVLKAVGWRTEAVGRLFLTEGALLGLVGGLTGGIGGAVAYVGLYGAASWGLLPAVAMGVGIIAGKGRVEHAQRVQVAGVHTQHHRRLGLDDRLDRSFAGPVKGHQPLCLRLQILFRRQDGLVIIQP